MSLNITVNSCLHDKHLCFCSCLVYSKWVSNRLSAISSLFPDVVNCMQTDNLELKKLVYLYLMNYAKSQPDMAIMAVNSFVKASPLTRSPRQSLMDGLFL